MSETMKIDILKDGDINVVNEQGAVTGQIALTAGTTANLPRALALRAIELGLAAAPAVPAKTTGAPEKKS